MDVFKNMAWAVLPVVVGLVVYNTIWPTIRAQISNITGV